METGQSAAQPLALLRQQYLQRLPSRLASWHEFWLYRCLELALSGLGRVAPNPLVGAVLVRSRSLGAAQLLRHLQTPLDARPKELMAEWPQHFELLGEGYHAACGALHAEAAAFADAQKRGHKNFEQAVLYCNLEPCSLGVRKKRQPPCCAQIIEKRVFAVVFANIDPNPAVSGRGAATLRRAGVEVLSGIFALPSAMWNQNFFRYISHGLALGLAGALAPGCTSLGPSSRPNLRPSPRPWVSLKMAQSLDACIASKSGQSQWISGLNARAMVQALRASSGARHSAVGVGRATLEADDPNLLLRPAFLQQLASCPAISAAISADLGTSQPWRVVWDSQQRSSNLPLQFYTSSQRVRSIVVCDASSGSVADKARIAVIRVHAPLHSAEGLAEALRRLREPPYNVAQLLLEGGPRLASSFLAAHLVDEIYCFISERFIGGGRPSLGDIHPGRQQVLLAESPMLQHTSYMKLREEHPGWDGPDELLVHGYLQNIRIPGVD